MKKTTIAILAIAVLVLGGVFIFAQKGNRDRFGGRGFGGRGFGGGGFMRMAEKLNLSDEQKTQVKTIMEDSQTRIKPLMEAMRENHKQAQNLGTDGVFNEEQVNQIAGSQSETMKQLFIEKEKTKAQIFAVLTPEQRAEAAKMKDQFKDNFRGKGKRRFGGKEEVLPTQE
jgi:protein CpxP